MSLLPLKEQIYSKVEIDTMIDVLKSDHLTMGKNVKEFETQFAKKIGSNYALMVNSGSSANLLALAVVTNFMRKKKLKKGDKVLIPAVCWSTSLFPIVQMGLIPVFVDSKFSTLNIDLNDMEKKIDENVKGIVAVHILGNCCDMDRFMSIVKKHDLILIEDTCESLGTTYKNKYLGTFGDVGTYSFYYSHHITTIEGGMIVCNSKEDYELLKCLRSHGWTRELDNKDEIEKQNLDINPQFLFVNLGYNLRPMEIQASMGKIQLNKLDDKNSRRKLNYNNLTRKIMNHPKNSGVLTFPRGDKNADVSWFGITLFLSDKYKDCQSDYLKYLTKNGIENRPIVSGNMLRQPVIKSLNIEGNPEDFKGAEQIHFRGFFINCISNYILEDNQVKKITDILLNYDKFGV